MSEKPSVRASELFLAQLELIEELIRHVGHRQRLPREDAEEFASYARLRLLAGDSSILRSYRGRSSLRTFLTTVVHRLFLDYRNRQWGKWRPSHRARKLGDVAVQLDRLISRDGLPASQAVEMVSRRRQCTLPREELLAIAAQLPPRGRRRFAGTELLENIATGGSTDERLTDRDRAMTAERTAVALAHALQTLTGEDRLILKMRFDDDFTVRQIAAALHRDPRPLYRRLEACLVQLRAALEAQGLNRGEVVEILGWDGAEIRVDLAGSGVEAPEPPPSTVLPGVGALA